MARPRRISTTPWSRSARERVHSLSRQPAKIVPSVLHGGSFQARRHPGQVLLGGTRLCKTKNRFGLGLLDQKPVENQLLNPEHSQTERRHEIAEKIMDVQT